MAESKSNKGNKNKNLAAVPPKQRTKGRITWAILLGVFGLLIALFASGGNVYALVAGAIVGAVLGYIIGRRMEKEVK